MGIISKLKLTLSREEPPFGPCLSFISSYPSPSYYSSILPSPLSVFLHHIHLYKAPFYSSVRSLSLYLNVSPQSVLPTLSPSCSPLCSALSYITLCIPFILHIYTKCQPLASPKVLNTHGIPK